MVNRPNVGGQPYRNKPNCTQNVVAAFGSAGQKGERNRPTLSPTATTAKVVARDTFLPVLKVPKAIFIATVKF